MKKEILKGQIYYADLTEGFSRDVALGVRLVLIIQNDLMNKYSPTVIICPISSRDLKYRTPSNFILKKKDYEFLRVDSFVMTERIRAIDKSRLRDYVGSVNSIDLDLIINSIMTMFHN